MAQYKLHCFCQSGNSFKVALYLNCAGLDWEPVFTDYMHGATRDPKWREAVNDLPLAVDLALCAAVNIASHGGPLDPVLSYSVT